MSAADIGAPAASRARQVKGEARPSSVRYIAALAGNKPWPAAGRWSTPASVQAFSASSHAAAGHRTRPEET
jgi:hypothetical protein